MCSWRLRPACDDEDDLVDAGRLVAPAQVAHLLGRADRAAQRAEALLQDLARPSGACVGGDDRAREADVVAAGEELLPDVRAPGAVVAEDVVVGERVAEEVRAVDAALDRRRLVGVRTSSAARTATLRVDREAAGHAALATR